MVQVNKFNFLRWYKPDVNPVILWEMSQLGDPYIDVNLRIFKNGTEQVNSINNQNGSISANQGDILKAVVYVAEVPTPVPTNGCIVLEIKREDNVIFRKRVRENQSVNANLIVFDNLQLSNNFTYHIRAYAEISAAMDEMSQPDFLGRELSTGYIRETARCGYFPIVIPYEPLRFYINTDEGISIPVPNTNTLDLINAQTGSVTVANVASLYVHQFSTSPIRRTHYAEVILPSTVNPGVYYFMIKNGSTEIARSSSIRVDVPGSDISKGTSLVTFRHDRYFYGLNYHELPNFYQQYRIHLNEIEDQIETDKEIYTEQTTGKQRTFKAEIKRVKKVETYYFDREAHEAAETMFEHKELYINGLQYYSKGAYKRNTNLTSKISKGEIELYDQEFASINRCG